MQFRPKTKNVRRFQEGGPVEDPTMMEEPGMTPEEAPIGPEQGGGDPLMQLAQIFVQGLQNQDCQMLAQGAQMFLQLIQQAQGGAPAGPEPQAEPVFRKGGRLAYRIRK